MRQDKAHSLAYWFGLAALALQIAFAPALSLRALAMDLDPLAMAKLCEPGRDVPMAPNHAGHCTDCCMATCAASQAMPAMAASFEPAFEPVGDQVLVLSPAVERPLARGPPALAFSPRGPPAFV
ncbi:MAG TPA: hypothetical protein VKP60_17685 [Magnetospirillaceae bacterium]|nr:hypothetical protein [Magnetospirillaceae bacterium]